MSVRDQLRYSWAQGNLKAAMVFVAVLAIALMLRLSYLTQLPVDRLDESYARWLIDVLTIRNSWVYTTPQMPPDSAVRWLPLFEYISALAMPVSNNYGLEPLRSTNLLLSLVAIAVLYVTMLKVFRSRWQATVAAVVLAFQPWHIDYSTTGTDRILLGLLMVGLTFAMYSGRIKLFTGVAVLCMLTAYDGWFIVALEIAIGLWLRRWSLKTGMIAIIASAAVVSSWLVWNLVATGNPFTFVAGYLQSTQYMLEFRPDALSFYIVLATAMTSGLFLIGLMAAVLRKTQQPRKLAWAIAILISGYVGFYSIAHAIGFDTGDLTGRIISILPLVAASMAFVFPTIHVRRRNQIAIGAALVAMLLISYYAQISIGPQKAYVIYPEERVGEVLRKMYSSGYVICDLPTVIYYSGLDPSIFRSSSTISWYLNSGNSTAMAEWLRANQITFIVWQNITTSQIPEILPSLGGSSNYSPAFYDIGKARLQLVYEDSLAAGNWEHNPDYPIDGPPPIFLFQVNLSA